MSIESSKLRLHTNVFFTVFHRLTELEDQLNGWYMERVADAYTDLSGYKHVEMERLDVVAKMNSRS